MKFATTMVAMVIAAGPQFADAAPSTPFHDSPAYYKLLIFANMGVIAFLYVAGEAIWYRYYGKNINLEERLPQPVLDAEEDNREICPCCVDLDLSLDVGDFDEVADLELGFGNQVEVGALSVWDSDDNGDCESQEGLEVTA